MSGEPDYEALSKAVDWTLFRKYEKSVLECRNRHVFEGYGKVLTAPEMMVISEEPCPVCGDFRMYRMSSKPELMVIRGKTMSDGFDALNYCRTCGQPRPCLCLRGPGGGGADDHLRRGERVIPEGNMSGGGLVKLVEECAETIKELAQLQQTVMKQLASPHTHMHWDGHGDLRTRLEDEMSDVLSALVFVQEKWGFDEARMLERAQRKLDKLRGWDK